MPVLTRSLRRLRAALLVIGVGVLVGSAPAYGGADVLVDDGRVFVASAEDERNTIRVEVKPGEPAEAPTTIRVRDASTALNDPGPESGCTRVEGASLATTYVECAVGKGEAEVVLGPGDDDAEIRTGNGPIAGLIFGGAGEDELQGGGSTDLLLGGEGVDIIFGGGGDDRLDGDEDGDGLDGEGGGDLLNGGPGGDAMFDSGASGVDSVTYFTAEQGVRVTVEAGNSDDGANAGAEGDDVGRGFERVQGSPFDDVIEGGPAAETINGSEGDDDLDGKGGADTVEGNEGEDVVRGRDEAADARLDCDSGSSTTQGARDKAIIDAAGVDPDPLHCESVERTANPDPPPPPPDDGDPPPPDGSGPPPPPPPPPVQLPAARSIPTVSGDLEAESTLTCVNGTWTGSPTFAFGWFAAGENGAPGKRLATGERYRLGEEDEGGQVYCAVLATNAAGAVLARSALQPVPDTVRMPNLNGLSLGQAREKVLDRTGGQVDFGDAKARKRDGRSIDAIPCELGGKKGDCEKARLKPGEVSSTKPKRGKRLLVPGGAGGKVSRVRLIYYDAGKDEKLPPVSDEKDGDDCPIRGSFSEAERESFINSIRGESEAEARLLLTLRECDYVVRYEDNRGQDADPYVKFADTGQINGKRGLKLTVARPRFNDLAVIPLHRRLQGRDTFAGANLELGPINPGVGEDGNLTTLRNDPNDICFAVVEASTGRLVPGAEVRARDPSGESVNERSRNEPQGGSTDENGVRCDRWRIDQEGTYKFTFVKRGDNGVDEEGYLDFDAVERNRKTFVTIGGREIRCTLVDCAQTSLTATGARARTAQLEVLAIVALAVTVSAIVQSVQNGRGVDPAVAAARAAQLAGPQPEATFLSAASESGFTPGILTLGGKLDPKLSQAPVVATSQLIGQDGSGLIGQDGSGLIGQDGSGVVPARGGNVVVVAGKLIGQDGSGLIGQDGSGIISGGAGNVIGQDGSGLIGQDGSGVVSRNATDVQQVGGRAVLVGAGNAVPAGTLIATGAGNVIPVAPIVSTGGGG